MTCRFLWEVSAPLRLSNSPVQERSERKKTIVEPDPSDRVLWDGVYE